MRNEFYWRQKKKPSNSLPLSGNLLKNPKLTGKIIQSTGLPQGWQRKYARSYENTSKIIVSGKLAILKITWSGGGAKFGVTPQLKTKLSPGNYSLRALAQTSAGSQAMLSVGNYQSVPVKAEKWQQVSVDFNVIAGVQPESIYWNLGSGQTKYKNFSLVGIDRQISTNFPITALAMPVEINRLTSGREEFNSFADNPVPLAFDFKGDGRKYKINKLVLEIPAALKISEAFDSHLNMHRVETPEIVKIIRNGKPFLRYSYTNPKIFRALKPDYAWERKLILAIEPSTPNLGGQSFPIYWYITAGPLKGQEQQFIVNLLSPLVRTILPKNFPILCWRMNDINYINPGILKKVAANYEKAGIKYYKRSHNPNPQLKKIAATLGRRGWKKFTTLPDYYAKRYYRAPFPVDTIKMAVDNKGKLTTHKMCPTYFNRDQAFRTNFHKLLDTKFAKDGTEDGDMICYDTEPWQPMEWCLCETCRQDFARQYKMKSVPSITTALTEYSDQWRDFRSAQTAETLKLQTEYLRKKFPDSPILDYDYVVNYNDPNYRSFFKSVAKDPALNEQYFDIHLASYYHHTGVKSFDLLKCNIEKLTKPYYVVSAIDKIGYLSKKYVLSPARIRLLLLASAVNGAEGFSIYPGMHLDGGYLKMFNQTLPIIAKLNSFFKKSTGIDDQVQITALPYSSRKIKTSTGIKTIIRPNWDDFFRFRAQQVKHKTLISLFNYNPQKTIFVKFSLKLNAGDYTIINAVTGQRMLPNNGQSWSATALADITTKIAPVNTTFLLIRKYRSSDDKLPAITQQQLQQEFSRLKSSRKSYNSFQPRSSGKLKISNNYRV
ncbi:MAG: hypothetical protein L3J71_00720 [Victivallaceae bacterium]|nr:hypothetical protein [Victivallaceae bacterium]